jgi:hypothetical protein
MRTAMILLASVTANVSPGQLVNGSFEDGLNGWHVHNYFGPDTASLTTEVAPDGGVQSMAMHINGYDVAFENQVVQYLGDLTPGTMVQFGGWMRALVAGFTMDTPQSITLCTCDSAGYAYPVGPDLIYTGPPYSWTFHQAMLTIIDPPTPGTTHCLKLGSGVVYQNLNFQAWFDLIFFQVDASTGTADISPWGTLPSRPNPATDKLWVDLSEAPLSITAIDAIGRTHDLKNFNHRDNTLEVEVNTLTAGICLLRITTATGTHAIRFVKA